jgi:hypothetical protein
MRSRPKDRTRPGPSGQIDATTGSDHATLRRGGHIENRSDRITKRGERIECTSERLEGTDEQLVVRSESVERTDDRRRPQRDRRTL